MKTGKMHVAMEDTVQVTSKIESSEWMRQVWLILKKNSTIRTKLQNVYKDSAEEPSMICYNKDDKLFSFEFDDSIKKEQFREWLRKQTNRFDASKSDHGTINLKMNNLILISNKSKNLIKIVYIMHKAELSPLDIEVINRSTARMVFQTKAMANSCLDFFKVHNKLVTAYIDSMHHKRLAKGYPGIIHCYRITKQYTKDEANEETSLG